MGAVHIFLIGMDGSGKRSLGRKLAASLGMPYVDTDTRVSQMMGMDRADIIRSLGESFYQNAETGVLIELIDLQPSIVSTGGDVPLVKENVQLMQNHGIIILIDRPLDQLAADQLAQAGASRSATDYEELVQRYSQRIGFYRACADYSFDNSHGPGAGAQGLIKLVNSLFSGEQ